MTTSLLETLENLLSHERRRLAHTLSPHSRAVLKRRIHNLAHYISSIAPKMIFITFLIVLYAGSFLVLFGARSEQL